MLILVVLIFAAAEDFFRKEISFWMPAISGLISLVKIAVDFCYGEMDFAGILFSLVPGVVLLIIAFATKQEIGYGDGLMALGFEKTCVVLCISMTMASLFSILLLIVKRDKRSTFPFIPFLTAGMGVTLFAKI